MFQGHNVSLRQVAKNQFELKTKYSLVRKTAAEITTMLDEQRREATTSVLEIDIAKRKLRLATEAESQTIPTIIPAKMPVPEAPEPVATIEASAPAEACKPVSRIRGRRSTDKHTVVVVEAEAPVLEAVHLPSPRAANDNVVVKPKKRPSGLAYLAWLETQRAC